MPIISLPSHDLYFESHGEGIPLILLNGLGLDVSAWGLQIPALSRTHRVVVYDARGVGRSSATPPPYRMADLVSDALALLDALEIEQAHLLGLSMGGLVAQRLAVDHPARVRGLILAATAARLPPRARHVIDLWARMVSTGTAPETLLREQLAWVFSEGFFADERQVAQVTAVLLANPHPPSPRGIAGQAAACLEHDARAEISRIRAPTLVLVGRDDLLLPLTASQELAAAIPGARLSILEGTGHAFATENAERFNDLVLEFLAHAERSRA
jgi:3-oxoadipate enol-lactonase